MLSRLLTYCFGSRNQRVLRQFWQMVSKINQLETTFITLPDNLLRAQTATLRERFAMGETLQDLLPEAFATVREAAKRTLQMRHFDVQLIGGMVLHAGNIAEMRTGEGKTLVATLAAYLNALPGRGVHIVTVNDYLAQRDAEWMRPLYEFLGLTVAVNLHAGSLIEKQRAYQADITYGTNNEFGFDYLRDNMVFNYQDKVQRPLHYAIIDEVDSILIDEARTPLIISGVADENTELYHLINQLIPKLNRQKDPDGPGDYHLDEKSKQAHLTEQGHQQIESLLFSNSLLKENESLYDAHNIILMHHVYAALRAHTLFHRDVDYIVQQGEVIIVDEHTGRTMPGRRWSEGLHQAIEAKENLAIHQENQTLATITFQNYFRLYEQLSGMTGTADTEAYEFQQIYNLEVLVIPPHRPMIRQDLPDFVYLSTEEKFTAIVNDIKTVYATSQPILVGTTSIETSEYLSGLLKHEQIPHQILNAKFHEQEAQIIAEAGRPYAVTIATNMAGRGTDIVLGGNVETELRLLETSSDPERQQHQDNWQQRHDKVLSVGGLYVLGTERHESRRIDNQLRGRAGRQGDPGRSRFYLSLQDNLLRIFGGGRLNNLMQRMGVEKGLALESRLLSRSIENAQRKVEAHHFDVRKQLLEYDDVANEQRQVIYRQREQILQAEEISDTIKEMSHHALEQIIRQFIPPSHEEGSEAIRDLNGLKQQLHHHFDLRLPSDLLATQVTNEQLPISIQQAFQEHYMKKAEQMGPLLKQFEKAIMLQTLDQAWREHLAAMDYLRQGIHLRGYAQKNPKQEYKRESFALFEQLLDKINNQVTSALSKLTIEHTSLSDTSLDTTNGERTEGNIMVPSFPPPPAPSMTSYPTATQQPLINKMTPLSKQQPLGRLKNIQSHPTKPHAKVGRNDPCPCGSKKKYKHCHGQLS